MSKMKDRALKANQEGMVAIITTMVIMVVVTLVVSSFALIVRREQQQSLDRQLSTQAFYAAESGISAAYDALQKNKLTGSITTCDGFGTGATGTAEYSNRTVSGNIGYSCVLVDYTPPELDQSLSPSDAPVIMPIKANGLTQITISWQNSVPAGSFESGSRANDFGLPQNGTLNTAMLKATLIPGFDGPQTRDSLLNGTQSVYLYPREGMVGSVDSISGVDGANGSLNGNFVSGNCNTAKTPYNCQATITLAAGRSYFLALKTYYQNAKVRITSDSPSGFIGAQATIDVTGKAADVLRRLQVKVPIDGSAGSVTAGTGIPEGSLQITDGICKKIYVLPDAISGNCAVPGSYTPMVNVPIYPPGVPPVPGGGGAGNGNAAFETCRTDSCNPAPGEFVPDYRWAYEFFNTSKVTNPSIIASCSWNFGDGTILNGSPTRSADACVPGQRIVHTFDDFLDPLKCYAYTITLVMYFNNGYPPERFTSDRLIPGGLIGGPQCRQKGYVDYPG